MNIIKRIWFLKLTQKKTFSRVKSKVTISDNVDKEKVQLLKKALIKAKEKGDEVLIKRLKKQLSIELGIDK